MAYTDPIYDHPFQGEIPSPDFSESQMWNFTDGNYGVIYHLGSMPGHLRLSHNAFAVTCPDGSVLATKVVGRPGKGAFGSRIAWARTIDPYKAWEVHFDGGLRRYRPEELWKGPGMDGQHIPVKVELNVTAAHLVWEPGLRSGEDENGLFGTAYKMHHEQALRTTGRIIIDGESIEFNAIGHRDHSFGPRDMSKSLRGQWINGTFASGWSFLGMNGVMDPTGDWERSAVFEQGRILEAVMNHNASLKTPAPQPSEFKLTFGTEDGRIRTINAKCTGGVNWFSSGRSEWCVGADLSNPQNYNWSMYFVALECDGERGMGFVDRGAHASLLQDA